MLVPVCLAAGTCSAVPRTSMLKEAVKSGIIRCRQPNFVAGGLAIL